MAFSGARALSATVQTISDWTTVSFSGTRYDTGPFWSAAQPTRLTVPAAGPYRVGHWLHSWLYSEDWTDLASAVMVNGVTVASANCTHRSLCLEPPLSFSVALLLAAGDYVEVQGYADPRTTGRNHSARGYNTCLAEAWIAREG